MAVLWFIIIQRKKSIESDKMNIDKDVFMVQVLRNFNKFFYSLASKTRGRLYAHAQMLSIFFRAHAQMPLNVKAAAPSSSLFST